jgi:hypothetical protein
MLRSLFGKGDKKAMSERQQILEMLASGKISVAEAEKLLNATEGASPSATAVEPVPSPAKGKARYLRVVVSEEGSEKVDVRVPLQLIRAGIKLGSLIPKDLQGKIDDSLHEKGMQFNLADMKPETVEELIDSLSEFSVNVDDGGDHVRVFCE